MADTNGTTGTRLEVQLARLEQRVEFWQIRYTELERRLVAIEAKEDQIAKTLTQWRGMGMIIISVGAALGWLLTSWETVRNLFR